MNPVGEVNYVIPLCTFNVEIKSQLGLGITMHLGMIMHLGMTMYLGITMPNFFWTVLNLSLPFSF